MGIIELIMGLFLTVINIGVSLVTIVIRLVLAGIAVAVAVSKRRSPILWGIIVFMVPWAIIILPFIPRKEEKLPLEIRNLEAFKGKNTVIASIMALSGMIAKLDGKVTKEETNLIREFIRTSYGLSKEQINDYAEAFNYGKSHPEQYAIFAQLIGKSYANRLRIIQIAYLLVGLGIEGDDFSQEKEAYIKRVLNALGLSNYEYESIKSSFTAQQYGGYQSGGYYNGGYQAQPQENLIKKYSEILGVSEDASMNEIKKAYRKLAKEYHPDSVAAEGMPADYVEFANKKTIEINEAYEYLKKIRE